MNFEKQLGYQVLRNHNCNPQFHPDPEIMGRPGLKTICFGPSGLIYRPHFGLKIRRGLGPPGPSRGYAAELYPST